MGKRQRSDLASTTDTASPAKREAPALSTTTISSPAKSEPSTSSVSTDIMPFIPPAYQQMLPGCPKGLAFLFSTRILAVLHVPTERLAQEYDKSKKEVAEEFRRFVAIKVFTEDHDAVKISPTSLKGMNTDSSTP
ncbi:hypothetical protein D0Z07_3275 [Hyphodiscus hymeniophilus]|uniref:Uncharacterized protein n=1 Tax=Hyphodiscus hymeniophilus TaxID=353542 RepID=A0A9P7AYQ5_9HELO|nr:hypothetical protein D0Z07_3275 [Hyphodiscus hymeniophilus]